MSLRDESRAQSVQIGVILLFGVFVILFSTYQAFVVPQQNAEVESEHLSTVDGQMQDVRNAIVSLPGAQTDRSLTVTLGTQYPARLVALNPPPPAGALRTAGTTDGSVELAVANATVSDDETGDYWTGSTERTYDTGALAYQPDYNEYRDSPTIVYENTALYEQFRAANLSVTGQRLIDGDELTLVTLNGTYDRATSESASLDLEAVSASSTTVPVTNPPDENVTLRVPTRRNTSDWRELLADDEQYTDQGGHVVRGGVTGTSLPNSEFDVVNVELQQGVQYDLTMAKAGVGSHVSAEGPAYLTDVSGDGASIEEGGTQELVLEVRDAYNNPVSGVEVHGKVEAGSLDNTTVSTGVDGRAVFEFDAGGASPDTYDADFRIRASPASPFEPGTPENVSMSVAVEEASDDGGGGGAYTLEWRDPSNSSSNSGADLSACSSNACTWDVGGSDDTTLALEALLDPPYGGIDVGFAVSDPDVAEVSPDGPMTDSNGSATTAVTPQDNGTVDVLGSATDDSDVIELTLENVTSVANVTGFPRVAYVDSNDGTLEGLDADGDTAEYTPSASEVVALGQPNVDVDGDGSREVPYVDDNDELRIVDAEGAVGTLDDSGNAETARLGVGDWNDDGTAEVVYVRDSVLYSVGPGETPSRLCHQACNGNPRDYQAQAVSGVADFDGDGETEVVYVDSNSDVAYFGAETDGPSPTGAQVDTPDAVSRPMDFDGDGSLEIAAIDGDGDFALSDQDGEDDTYETEDDVRQDALGGLDVTGDDVPDVLHVDTNSGEMRYYDVVEEESGPVTDRDGNAQEPQAGPGIG